MNITSDGIFWAAREFKRRFPKDLEELIEVIHNPRAQKARSCPDILSEADVEGWLVRFLNKWDCRLPYGPCGTSGPLREALVSTTPARSGWEHRSLEDGLDEGLLEGVSCVFTTLQHATSHGQRRRSLGAVPAAKSLGVLYPALCVMWDNEIRKHYGCSDSEAGYVSFLRTMSETARGLVAEWESRGAARSLSEAVCQHAKYDVPLPLAILIDHYNWLTIKKGLEPPLKD